MLATTCEVLTYTYKSWAMGKVWQLWIVWNCVVLKDTVSFLDIVTLLEVFQVKDGLNDLCLCLLPITVCMVNHSLPCPGPYYDAPSSTYTCGVQVLKSWTTGQRVTSPVQPKSPTRRQSSGSEPLSRSYSSWPPEACARRCTKGDRHSYPVSKPGMPSSQHPSPQGISDRPVKRESEPESKQEWTSPGLFWNSPGPFRKSPEPLWTALSYSKTQTTHCRPPQKQKMQKIRMGLDGKEAPQPDRTPSHQSTVLGICRKCPAPFYALQKTFHVCTGLADSTPPTFLESWQDLSPEHMFEDILQLVCRSKLLLHEHHVNSAARLRHAPIFGTQLRDLFQYGQVETFNV